MTPHSVAEPVSGAVVGNPPDIRDRHFDADRLGDDLEGRTVRGGLAVLAAQVMRFGLQIGSTAILARLLTPADFGLVAMVTAVTGFLSHFKDMGLTMATVQRARVSHAEASNLFWVNVGLSLLLTALCIAVAPFIALFFDEPQLVGITVAMAFTFLFSGLAAQHLALLRRQMQFQRLAVIEVAGFATGVTAGLALAWQGAGYWALVGVLLADTITRSMLMVAASGWWPGLPQRHVSVRPLLRFGLNVSAFNILAYVERVADHILIGRFLGASAIGFYTKAYGLLMLPLEQVNTPINSVAVPALSRLQTDPARYRQFYYRSLVIIAYLTAPLIVLMAATADNLVLLVLGPQWDRAAHIFQYLAVAAIFQPLLFTAGWVWLSLGRTHEMLRWSMVTAPCYMTCFVIGLPWGPEGVAAAYAVCVNLLAPIGLRRAYRGTELSVRGMVAAVRRPYVLSGLLLVVALLMQALLAGTPPVVNLPITVAVSLGTGLAVGWLHPSTRQELMNLFAMVKRLRQPGDGAAAVLGA